MRFFISILILALPAAPTFAQLPQYCEEPPELISKSLPQSMWQSNWSKLVNTPTVYVITQLVVETDGSTSNFRSEVIIDPPEGLSGAKDIFKKGKENYVSKWKYVAPSERCLHIDVTKKPK